MRTTEYSEIYLEYWFHWISENDRWLTSLIHSNNSNIAIVFNYFQNCLRRWRFKYPRIYCEWNIDWLFIVPEIIADVMKSRYAKSDYCIPDLDIVSACFLLCQIIFETSDFFLTDLPHSLLLLLFNLFLFP